LQEFHEPGISKALAKASNMAESSQVTPSVIESISESPEVMEIHSDWCTLFMIYLRTGGLPEDKDEHERLRHRIGHYTLLNDELFWRSINSTQMKCITPDEGRAILHDIHTWIYGSHYWWSLSQIE
jgi:hypothetical protein